MAPTNSTLPAKRRTWKGRGPTAAALIAILLAVLVLAKDVQAEPIDRHSLAKRQMAEGAEILLGELELELELDAENDAGVGSWLAGSDDEETFESVHGWNEEDKDEGETEYASRATFDAPTIDSDKQVVEPNALVRAPKKTTTRRRILKAPAKKTTTKRALSAPCPTFPLSTNGRCGAARKRSCPRGQCCSRNGYCGSGPAWCGNGCQAGEYLERGRTCPKDTLHIETRPIRDREAPLERSSIARAVSE